MADIPPNVHVSRHPCLVAKISQLRSKNATSKETEQLVHDISVMLGMEALATLELIEGEPVSQAVPLLRPPSHAHLSSETRQTTMIPGYHFVQLKAPVKIIPPNHTTLITSSNPPIKNSN